MFNWLHKKCEEAIKEVKEISFMSHEGRMHLEKKYEELERENKTLHASLWILNAKLKNAVANLEEELKKKEEKSDDIKIVIPKIEEKKEKNTQPEST